MNMELHDATRDDSRPEVDGPDGPQRLHQGEFDISESDNQTPDTPPLESVPNFLRTVSVGSDGSQQTPSSAFINKITPATAQPTAPKKFRLFSAGMLVAFAAAMCFSCGSFPLKFVNRVSPFEFVFIRGLMQLLLANIVIVKMNFSMSTSDYLGHRPQVKYLMARGICGSLGLCLYYWAIKNMPYSEAVVIMQSQPIYMAIFAHIFLKEKLCVYDGVITLVAMAGTLMITQPKFLVGSTSVHQAYPFHAFAALCAVCAAILVATAYVCVRRLKETVHFTTPLVYFSIFGVLESVIVLTVIDDWKLPDCYTDRVLMIVVAVCAGFLGQICLMRALQIERGLTVTLVNGFQVVIAFILQAIFLRNEALTWLSILGSVCVTSAVTAISARKYINSPTRLFCRSKPKTDCL